MSSVFTLDNDPIVIVVPSAANIPPGNITESEWLQLKDRVTGVESYGINDLGDVDLSGIEDGQVLVWSEADQVFVPIDVANGIRTRDNTGSIVEENATDLIFRLGVTAIPATTIAGRVYVQPTYGTAANTVAEGNHRHIQPLPARVTTAPSGYMSGGARSLGSTSVTLNDGVPYLIEAEVYGQLRGADAGAAYYTIRLDIDGDTRSSPSGADGFWCVQGVPDKMFWEHSRRMGGTGTSITVSASISFDSGAGFNVDRTYLKVRLRPDR